MKLSHVAMLYFKGLDKCLQGLEMEIGNKQPNDCKRCLFF